MCRHWRLQIVNSEDISYSLFRNRGYSVRFCNLNGLLHKEHFFGGLINLNAPIWNSSLAVTQCGLFHALIPFFCVSEWGEFMGTIKINKLSFQYDGMLHKLFDQFSLNIDENWKLGLIGRNGRGKTTFLKLLLGKLHYQGTIDTTVGFRAFPQRVSNPRQKNARRSFNNCWIGIKRVMANSSRNGSIETKRSGLKSALQYP